MRQRNVSTTNLVALRPLKNYLKFPFFLFVLLLAAASLSGCVTSAGTGVVVGPDPYYRPYPRPYYRAYRGLITTHVGLLWHPHLGLTIMVIQGGRTAAATQVRIPAQSYVSKEAPLHCSGASLLT
ncbi:hypothetical protein [Hymenobacter sp. AT01-02]|uniref:hypothetical protein n=1 Tax=Hymenobacter sp. AT01-02 TaxID=1571877 RepID=UPI000A71A2E4|nr:hypothetical protein [Hymenobacter sp. AT01-02]